LGKNRDRLSLIAAILEAAGSGANKTRIMYGANLSFKLLEKYLDTAVEVGFVKVNGSKYVLTDFGREFLKEHRSYDEKHSRVQDALEFLARERERLCEMCEKPSTSSAANTDRVSRVGNPLFEDLDLRNRNPNNLQDELNRRAN
jgi:predicted transcriptional regulator